METDYKKLYEDALVKIKDLYDNYDEISCLIDMKQEFEKAFPELKESEDERIRSALLRGFNSMYGNQAVTTFAGEPIKNILSWLEKHGEQNSIEQEPFEIEHGKYYYCIKDYYSGGKLKAKRGDVVQALRGMSIMILDSMEAGKYFLPVNKIEKQGEQEETPCDRCRKAQPEHSCQDITELGRCYQELEKQVGNSETMKKNLIKDGIKLVKQGKQKLTDSYCQENCKGFQETGRCFADGECKAKREAEQKPTWSKEDEDAIGIAIEALEELCDVDDPNATFIDHELSFAEAVKRLKALKPQSHWKPTKEQLSALYWVITNIQLEEEDEETLQALYKLLKNYNYDKRRMYHTHQEKDC